MLKFFFSSLIMLPLLLSATELKPWYEKDLTPESRTTVMFQCFNKMQTSKGKRNYNSRDLFMRQSLAVSFDTYAAEVELTTAATRKQHFNLDNLKLTGRYRLMNDVVDDPYSVVAGVSLIQAGEPALHDPASFHHGILAVETHLSVGKEVSAGRDWINRYYGVFALGFSSGLPWMRADFSYEINKCNMHQIQIFAKTLMGFGGKSLDLNSFHGYGSIRHRSIDLGAGYSYLLEEIGGIFSAEYAFRVYSQNFPDHSSRFLLTFFYPFGFGF